MDVSNFRRNPDAKFMSWRVRNISNPHTEAGVKREAFLFPKGAQIPQTMNQSVLREQFLTQGFDNPEEATAWLTGPNRQFTMSPSACSHWFLGVTA